VSKHEGRGEKELATKEKLRSRNEYSRKKRASLKRVIENKNVKKMCSYAGGGVGDNDLPRRKGWFQKKR